MAVPGCTLNCLGLFQITIERSTEFRLGLNGPLNASLLRAPLCGDNNIMSVYVIYDQVRYALKKKLRDYLGIFPI